MLKTQPTVRAKGVAIPALGLGTWQLEGSECESIVEEALHRGYRHIDTAQAYGNEEQVGSGLKKANVERKNIFLTTKVWTDNFEPGALKKSVEASLKKLKTDYVDLLLLHWPKGHTEATLDALMQVRESGQALAVGISNFTTDQLEKAQKHTGDALVANQVEYHPFLDQSAVLEAVRKHDMALTAYSPLARGEVFENDTLAQIAKERNLNPGQVTLAWLLSQNKVVAIPKTSSKDHLKSNFQALEVELTPEELKKIDGLRSKSGRRIDPDFAPDWD